MSSTPIYDFRDGLLDKESTYTDTSIDVSSHFLYFVVMGVCWCWGLDGILSSIVSFTTMNMLRLLFIFAFLLFIL